ncbi:hypothetical protein PspLS_07499 [Pyricularia sp. CBS 133598]|nr:hypothetical protein PspLS_07499 [Pyricularia sp. CBS 133598]
MGAANSTLVGWTIVLAIAGFVGWREWDAKQKRLLQKTAGQRSREEHRKDTQSRRDTKKDEKEHSKVKRQRVADSQPEKPKEKEPVAAPVEKEQPKASKKKSNTYSSDDDAASNREFARQLSSVKEGTKFTAKSKDDVRQKSVKQSRADEAKRQVAKPVEEPKAASPPSSTTGIDADDDQSSAASPVVAPTATAGDVSDMLEKPTSGPSVLRLTDTEEKKKTQKAKAPQPVETKKQRQNRKKVEAAKAMREEAEAERKILEQAQRRTAREAEGRAAKDGSGFMAAQAKGTVWTGGKDVNSSNNGVVPVQPLDTSEPAAAQSKTQQKQGGAAKKEAKGDKWVSALPSEEEQIKMIEDEESWSTVPTKASRKSKKSKESAVDSMDEGAASETKPAPAAAPAPTPVQPAKKPQVENQRPVKTFSQTSSFAALNADGAADLEEEEWDV